MNIKLEVKKYVEKNRCFFDKIHNNPESSFNEFKTTSLIKDFCDKKNLQIIDIGMKTGVLAYLNANSNKTVALRADIDAVSTENGARHLCGHDAHTVSLLCAADFLSDNKKLLKSNVLFVFQPAEEVTEGAIKMLNSGMMEKIPNKPEIIFGIHNRPEIPLGKIAVHKGALMAQKSNFTLEFIGKTGHGGQPHQCIDPIVAAAQFISSLQTVVSRNIDPFQPAVCTVCSVHGGSTDNFAPENVILTGSIRTLDENVHNTAKIRLEELANKISDAFNCRCKLEIIPIVPLLFNSEYTYNKALTAAKNTVGENNVTDTLPCLGSEDFSVFGKHIPSFFYWVGNGTENGINPPWHSNDFKILDGYIEIAAELLINSALL